VTKWNSAGDGQLLEVPSGVGREVDSQTAHEAMCFWLPQEMKHVVTEENVTCAGMNIGGETSDLPPRQREIMRLQMISGVHLPIIP
jgi:hypothetical protein